MRKIASLLLALVMVFSLAATAFAADTGNITIVNNTANSVKIDGRNFVAIKVLDATKSGTATAYYVPTILESFYKTYFTITDTELAADTIDNIVTARIAALSTDELYEFGKDINDWCQANGTASTDPTLRDPYYVYAVGADGKVEFKNLPMGYYVIVDLTLPSAAHPSVSAVILRTPGENVEVRIKADQNDVDKKIDGNVDTDPATYANQEGVQMVPYNNTSIGDKVPYEVVTKIPAMVDFSDYIFKITDTMSKGLTYNNDLKIVVNNKNSKGPAQLELSAGTHYTATATTDTTTGVTTLVISFIDFEQWYYGYVPHSTGTYYVQADGSFGTTKPAGATTSYLKTEDLFTGDELKLTYTTTVDTDAIIGVKGNPNAVTLEYSRDSKDFNLTSKTTEKRTRTFTTGLELLKVDDQGNTLTGAQFKLTGTRTNTVLVSGTEFVPSASGTYYKLNSGNFTTDAPTDDTESLYDQTKWYQLAGDPIKYTDVAPTDATAGSYLNGINATPYRTYAKVDFTNRPVTTSDTVEATAYVGDDGKLVFSGLGAGAYTITELISPEGYNLLKEPVTLDIFFTAPTTETGDATWTGKYKLTPTGAEQNMNFNNDTGLLEFSVVNNAGTELPTTGGMGTTLFYVFGSIMMIGAAILLVTKKRMAN